MSNLTHILESSTEPIFPETTFTVSTTDILQLDATTATEKLEPLWNFGPHEIISIAIVGVSVLTARKSHEVSESKEIDENTIEGIFVTRSDWENLNKPSEIQPCPSKSSIKSFI